MRFPQFAGELRAQFEIHRALQSGHAFTLELSSASFDLEYPSPNSDAIEAGNRCCAGLTRLSQNRSAAPRAELAALRQPLESTWPALGGYEIQAVLGSGGMGTVYRAFDLATADARSP